MRNLLSLLQLHLIAGARDGETSSTRVVVSHEDSPEQRGFASLHFFKRITRLIKFEYNPLFFADNSSANFADDLVFASNTAATVKPCSRSQGACL